MKGTSIGTEYVIECIVCGKTDTTKVYTAEKPDKAHRHWKNDIAEQYFKSRGWRQISKRQKTTCPDHHPIHPTRLPTYRQENFLDPKPLYEYIIWRYPYKNQYDRPNHTEIADLLGITREALSAWSTGRRWTTFTTADKVCMRLGIRMEDIWEDL